MLGVVLGVVLGAGWCIGEAMGMSSENSKLGLAAGGWGLYGKMRHVREGAIFGDIA